MRTLLVLAAVAALALQGSAAAATSPAVGTSKADGAVPYGGGYAIPLRGARPDWYTANLESKVAASGVAAAPASAPLPGEVGIRPGSWMIAPYGCTMNFVFQNGGSYAIGTAGHCVDAVGQNATLLTLAPGGANPVLVQIGPVLARHDNGIGDDFALLAVPPALNAWVDPTTAVVAGPCGGYYGSGPESVWHYGHGLALGTGGTPRAGVALTWQTDAFGWDGAATPGDSGSPVRVGTGFAAAGNLTHLVVSTTWLPSFIAGTRIGKILQIATGWSLVSSPLCL